MSKRADSRVHANVLETLESRTMLSASGGFKLAPLMPSPSVSTQATPADPSYGSLWGLPKISAPAAWDITTGKTTITVADIDSGIDYTHTDLFNNVWINQAEIPSDRKANLTDLDSDGLITFYDLNNPVNQGAGKISDTNSDARIDARDLLASYANGGWADGVNGVSYLGYTYNGINYSADPYVDDIIGWNFAANSNNPFDGGTTNSGHGTHTAGTIGAVGNNGTGITGVNWKTQLMSLKIFADNGNPVDDITLGNAIRYAFNNGAGIANASWGGSGGVNSMTDPLYASIKEGGDRKNFLFVASAGNGDILFGQGYSNDAPAGTWTYPVFPATYNLPNIIAVAATNSSDGLGSFSNYGPTSVDLGAPGVGILSTLPNNSYGSYDGTSMAAPHVTGVAALLRSLQPDASAAAIKGAILGGVDAVSALAGKTVTGGRLNALKAIQQLPVANPAAPTGLTATAVSSSQINVKWNDVVGESGYRLQRSTDSTFVTGVSTFNLSAGVTSYNDTGLAATTAYYYRLQSIGTSTNSAFVTTSATTLAVAATPPAAPRINSANTTTSSIKLNWSNVASETGYKIEELIGGVWTQIGQVGADVVSFTDAGLRSNHSYSYRVRAFNAAGNSAYSNTVNVRTPKKGTGTVTFRLAGTFSAKAIHWANVQSAIDELDKLIH